MEYCYSELFGIRRFPGYEVFPMRSGFACKCLINNAEITEKDIEYACTQLWNLYQYTQNRLREEQGETYKLHRKLTNFEIESLGEQLNQGQEDLSIQSNILSCYCHSNAYTQGVVVVRDVDIQDIVMVDYMTSYTKEFGCEKTVPLEDAEGEVWVLNRDRFGKLPIKRAWIIGDLKPEKTWYQSQKPLHIKIEEELNADDGVSMIESRIAPQKPCQLDDPLTKWVMKRNQKRIRKMHEQNHL